MSKVQAFQKVGECLYRNSSSGFYFALVKWNGKQIRRNLKTKDPTIAKRLLRDFRGDAQNLDPAGARVTLEQLCLKYEQTIQHLSASTLSAKKRVLKLLAEELPGGTRRRADAVKPSEIKAFLARSPVELTEWRKRKAPIRPTPSVEEFRAIVGSIRSQPWSDTREESADFVEFLGLAGLGLAEASALTWGDVDFGKGKLTTFRQKTRTGFEIPIFPQLRPFLERRREQAIESNGGTDPHPEIHVFKITDPKKAVLSACERLNYRRYS